MKLFIFCILSLISFYQVFGIKVSLTGSDVVGCSETTLGCRSLRYAIDDFDFSTASNDTYTVINIGPGTYTGPNNRAIFFEDRRVSLFSESGDPTDTIIDCQRQGRGFVLQNSNVTFRGLTVKNCLSDENPGRPGAAFYSDSSYFEVTDCILSYHDAPPDVSATGGVFYLRNSNPKVTNTKFLHNIAGVAGAVYLAGTSAPVFRDCAFINNTVYEGGWGGAIVPEERSNGTWINCDFEQNYAAFGASVDDGGFANSNWYGCRFFNNTGLYAGGYYGYGTTTAYFKDCYFGYNIATNTGGAVRTTSEVKPVFDSCLFEYNVAKSGPGMALYGQSYTVLRNCTFRNHAGQAGNGGAAAVVSASALFIDSYFVNMTGQESGGVISALGSPLEIVNCTFVNCSAVTGGAVELISATGKIVNSTFIGNRAQTGGALSIVGESEMIVDGNRFINNYSPEGGAITIRQGAITTLTDNVLESNTGDKGAGFFFADTAVATVNRAIIRNNVASGNGGGIYLLYGSSIPEVNVFETEISGNIATYGSGIYIEQGYTCDNFNFANISLNNNNARISGAISFGGANASCDNFCKSCQYNSNVGLYGNDFSTGFHNMVLSGDHPSELFAGQLFTTSFSMKDFFNHTMRGKLDIQVFVVASSGIKLLGVNTQTVKEDGIATFESIAVTGLPGDEYYLTYYTIPASPSIIVPITITPCQEGYLGYSTIETGDDFVCLKIGKISSAVIIVISVLTSILIIATIALMGLLYWKRMEPVIRRAQVVFCELVAFGALFSYIGIYMWTDTPTSMCVLRMYFFGIGISTILSALIVKEYKIYFLFKSAEKMKNRSIKDGKLYIAVGVLVGIDILLLILWSAIDPPVETASIHLNEKEITYICSSKNSEVFLWVVLGYKMLLMVAGVILSFMSRNIPESFNESKFIAFSIYNYIIAIVVMMPLLYIIKEVTATFAIVGFGTLFYTTVPLMMLFLPKLYYSINKRAVIEKLDREIDLKTKEISILKRERKLTIKDFELEKEYEVSKTNASDQESKMMSGNESSFIEMNNTSNTIE